MGAQGKGKSPVSLSELDKRTNLLSSGAETASSAISSLLQLRRFANLYSRGRFGFFCREEQGDDSMMV